MRVIVPFQWCDSFSAGIGKNRDYIHFKIWRNPLYLFQLKRYKFKIDFNMSELNGFSIHDPPNYPYHKMKIVKNHIEVIDWIKQNLTGTCDLKYYFHSGKDIWGGFKNVIWERKITLAFSSKKDAAMFKLLFG